MVKNEIIQLINDLKLYRGLKRKSCIKTLANILTKDCKYDDAGWFKAKKGEYVVVSTDGITEELVSADPWKAGFYSVLVNVNDIVAKGCKPVGFAGIVASKNQETRIKITNGIKQALDLYNLTVLKMHVLSDATIDGVSGTSIGVANEIIPSYTAKNDDKIIIAIDIKGKLGEDSWVRTYDSIQFLNKNQVLKRIQAMNQIAEKRFANASRDISVPGVLGSLLMLCESSRVGAKIKIDKIPKPEDITVQRWLMCYPSFGFILTTDIPEKCIEILKESGYEVSVVGEITIEKKVRIEFRGEEEIFSDLDKESIFGT